MKFRLITTVWGPRFANLFLRVTVRSLLGEGNIDVFRERHEAVYSIYTTPETAEELRQSPLFQRLASCVEIDFVLFGAEEIDPKVPSCHWIGWRRGAEIAAKNGEIAFFIIADMLYAANTLLRWVGLFDKGYRAIWTSTTQVVLETAIREVEAKFPPVSLAPISMSNEEVIDLGIRHLHPFIVCMFRDTPRASRHPEVVFAEIPGEGFAQRAIGSHPMCVDPNFFRMSDAFSPLNRFEAIAFEEATGLGLEPLLKVPDLYARRAPIDGDRLSNMGSWLDYNCAPSDLIESMRTYRFSKGSRRNDEGFKRARARLGFYACQVRLTGSIYRVVREMRRAECTLAAQITASAHYVGRLRRHWRTRGPISVFVPNDSAMRAWGIDRLSALLRIGNETELARAALEHVFVGRQELEVGDEIRLPASEVTAATTTIRVVARSARVLAGPIECDDCTIYVIDRVLMPSPSVQERACPTLLPNSWSLHQTRRRLSREEQQEAAAELSAAPREASTTVRTLARSTRSILQTGYRMLRTVPGANRLAERMKWRVVRFFQRLESLYEEQRAPGFRKDIAAVFRAASAPAEATGTHGPTQQSIEAFRDLQRARATLTVLEVLVFYRSKLLNVLSELPALSLVDSCVRDAGVSERAIEERLERLLDHEPNFAEAWYELGDIRLGNGHYAEAIRCFDRCLDTKQGILVPPGRTRCDALAAAAKAVALERSGSLEVAAAAYRRAIGLGNHSGPLRVAYGRLLRRLGTGLEAAAEFEAGMQSDATALVLPPMPPDFSQLARRLVEVFGNDPSGRKSPETWSLQ